MPEVSRKEGTNAIFVCFFLCVQNVQATPEEEERNEEFEETTPSAHVVVKKQAKKKDQSAVGAVETVSEQAIEDGIVLDEADQKCAHS